MILISFSKTLSEVIHPFRKIIMHKTGKGAFIGWGRRKYGEIARKIANLFNLPFLCIEDGFIRSIEIGKSDSIFSIVVDDKGIYYDANSPSKLEDIINHYDFKSDISLMDTALQAFELITQNNITKYNHAPDIEADTFIRDGRKRVLIIAQTAGDMSLKYGMADHFTTVDILKAAQEENPGAALYLKIHPDVLNGIKKSDIDISDIGKEYTVLCEDVNAISLLRYVDKVYTKTSQMGFEALLLGKEVVCFGLPFYAGWGLSDDRVSCERRCRNVSVLEVLAAAYILYPLYFNPYTKQKSDILDIIETIIRIKNAE